MELEKEIKPVEQSIQLNAFIELMKNSSNCYVKLIKNLMNPKERLFNDFISFLQNLNVNFTHMCVETLRKDLVQTLCGNSWHVTSHYKYFSDRGCPIADLLSTFKDSNDYQWQKS